MDAFIGLSLDRLYEYFETRSNLKNKKQKLTQKGLEQNLKKATSISYNQQPYRHLFCGVLFALRSDRGFHEFALVAIRNDCRKGVWNSLYLRS